MQYLRHIVALVGVGCLGFGFFALADFGEKEFLYAYVSPVASTIEQWLDGFAFYSGVAIAGALLGFVLWYILGQWVLRPKDWKKVSLRSIWLLLLLIPSATAVVAILSTSATQQGGWLADLFYIVNSTVCYYLASVLFSPSAYKFTPIGAGALRRWW